MIHRYAEILVLSLLILISLTALCWGPVLPPDPPSTPIVNPFMCAATMVTMAAYGFWKMRK